MRGKERRGGEKERIKNENIENTGDKEKSKRQLGKTDEKNSER
jgi:hypothetical protein